MFVFVYLPNGMTIETDVMSFSWIDKIHNPEYFGIFAHYVRGIFV